MAEFAQGFRDGVDINLGVGYVNEDTIPVAGLSEALLAVAMDGVRYRQAFNYGSPAGSVNLIRSLRRFLKIEDSPLRLAIGACGATSILEALTDVMEPGVVVTSDPVYYIYSDVLERKGFEILAVQEDDEGINLAALEAKIRGRDNISFLYVVTVNNPSCTILSNARRQALLQVATRLSAPIFYDLAYELLLHDPAAEPFVSVLPRDAAGLAYEIGTLSKVLAPALRIGYVLGPDGALMNALIQKTGDTGFSAPLFVQEMASFMLDYAIDEQLRAVNAGYREKAVAVRAGIEKELGPYLEECRGGRAGFYFYLTFKEIETHTESAFFRYLTRTHEGADRELPRIIYIPGQYCVHSGGDLAEKGKRQLRLSYGFEEVPQILSALQWMRKGVEFVENEVKQVT